MKIEDIKIDPSFRDLLCPLSEYEEKALEGTLLAHGCLSPLIVEEKLGVLIDGHNRLRLCEMHGIPYEVKTLMLGGREPSQSGSSATN
jgi:ParB-like chromosome segregation protein Spo0J